MADSLQVRVAVIVTGFDVVHLTAEAEPFAHAAVLAERVAPQDVAALLFPASWEALASCAACPCLALVVGIGTLATRRDDVGATDVAARLGRTQGQFGLRP
jgi:hypothetical protein